VTVTTAPPRTERLIPVVAVHALVRALAVEASWKEAAEMTGGPFPESCCVEASVALRDELAEHLPECAPVYVWGDFIAGIGPVTTPVGLAWVEVCGGLILDITVSQFFKTELLPLVFPDTFVGSLYRPRERPAWA
jgi:hypothetical protein